MITAAFAFADRDESRELKLLITFGSGYSKLAATGEYNVNGAMRQRSTRRSEPIGSRLFQCDSSSSVIRAVVRTHACPPKSNAGM